MELHRLFNSLENFLWKLTYFSKFSRWVSENPCYKFNNFRNGKVQHNKRFELYRFVVEKEVLKEECIDYLAFGVYKGESLKWWIDNNNNRESSFVGFDTFTGLPESWDNIKKGTFSVNGKIPDI